MKTACCKKLLRQVLLFSLVLYLSVVTAQAVTRVLGPLFITQILVRDFHFDITDDLCTRILADYGSIFIADRGVTSPPTYMFKDQPSAETWQESVARNESTSAGPLIVLQKRALEEFEAARKEAKDAGLTLRPAEKDASIRTYAVTVALWNSRMEPGLIHWVEVGKLPKSTADAIRPLPPSEQVKRILELEENGLYFSKDFQKSILYSVAAPGTSQHLSLLAIDIVEHEDSAVRGILARHGWFQTVYSDLPHFTFLGYPESRLPFLGLVKKIKAGHAFWIVDAKGTHGEELHPAFVEEPEDERLRMLANPDECPF